ncbi:hypothetical protein LXL04_009083 [Taraxacum kok-saghyz]
MRGSQLYTALFFLSLEFFPTGFSLARIIPDFKQLIMLGKYHYPKGSPTTRKATSNSRASNNMSSAFSSTISLSATKQRKVEVTRVEMPSLEIPKERRESWKKPSANSELDPDLQPSFKVKFAAKLENLKPNRIIIFEQGERARNRERETYRREDELRTASGEQQGGTSVKKTTSRARCVSHFSVSADEKKGTGLDPDLDLSNPKPILRKTPILTTLTQVSRNFMLKKKKKKKKKKKASHDLTSKVKHILGFWTDKWISSAPAATDIDINGTTTTTTATTGAEHRLWCLMLVVSERWNIKWKKDRSRNK